MELQTRLFGHLSVSEDKIVYFAEGIPGFEHLQHFVVIILEQTKPFYWLQALDEDIALPLISPFEIDPDYSPVVPADAVQALKLEREEDLLVLAVAVIPADVTAMTANLAAPVLINIVANLGQQVLVEGAVYPVRMPIYDVVYCRLHAGGR
ncbi:MAG: Flagellar assembly factor fliW [Firmicutes bacterium]|nr:Flagellar assembly factor fliW [Bacillota bacterium]